MSANQEPDHKEEIIVNAASAEGRGVSSPQPLPERLGGYLMIRELGRGGFGVVYLGQDPKLGRPVAIKALWPHRAAEPGYVERFVREARSAAGLRHPNIVTVYATGEDQGSHFMVMEYLEGRTLHQVLQAGPLDEKRALKILRAVAQGLEYSHDNGIIHRDLKPLNVMIGSREDEVKILDFGLAKPEQSGTTLTQSGQVTGTPHYMSPEQAQDSMGKVDKRSDLFSLGVMLYQCVTGELPFDGDSAIEILLKVVDRDPVPPNRVKKGIGRDLEAVILKSLEKERDRRYQSASEFLEDLDHLLKGEPVKAKKRTRIGRWVRWVKKNRKMVTGSIGLVVVVTSLIGMLAQNSIHQRDAVAQAARQQAEKAKRDAATQSAALRAQQEAAWETRPFWEFRPESLEQAFEITGDPAGWSMQDGALEYFGYAGGVAWIRTPVVGDFRLEVEFELPEWTEQKLDQAIHMHLQRAQLPLPPPGVRLSPPKESWPSHTQVKDLAGFLSGIEVSGVAYNLASYVEVDTMADGYPFHRIHVGGMNMTSPRDPQVVGWASATAIVSTDQSPWTDERGNVTVTGGGFRCVLGAHSLLIIREKDVLTVRMNGEEVIQGTATMGDKLRLGFGIHSAQETFSAGIPGVDCWSVFNWHRFKKARLFRKGRALLESPLSLPERLLAEGDPVGAEKAFRDIMTGLDPAAQPWAHLGLARSLAEQGRPEAGIAEFKTALQLGVNDLRRKLAVARALRSAGGTLVWPEIFSSTEIVEAWRSALIDGPMALAEELEAEFSVDQVNSLLTCLKDPSGLIQTRAWRLLFRLRNEANVKPTSVLRVPKGCTAWPWTNGAQIDGLTWAGEIIHEDTGMDLLLVLPGRFMMSWTTTQMGKSLSGPRHEVRIETPFYLGRYEVTRAQYDRFLKQTGRPALECIGGSSQSDDEPAACVSLGDSQAFCEWAGMRLPSEAEWDYARLAGTDTAHGFGPDGRDLGEYAWYYFNSGGVIHPVGQRSPNLWGFFDMNGNVSEWCADRYHKEWAHAPTDGSAWTDDDEGDGRIIRGASALDHPLLFNSGSRETASADTSNSTLGFRAALSLSHE